MNTIDISPWRLSLGYLLLILPFGIILWRRIPIFGQTLTAVVRMTLQLLFVGLYLQVVFKLDNPWINGAWLLVMIGVADASIARTSRIRLRTFALTLFAALAVGTAVPLAVFVGPILNLPNLMEAQYVIPIGGMILGNCLRSDIIGISDFYERLRRGEKVYLQNLAQGAALHEALRPYIRDACEAALKPTVATMATIGLVSLPGMMTGVMLGGVAPMTAIKYQLAIMIAIFSGTALTVLLALLLAVRRTFTPFGVLDRRIFKP